MKVLRALVFVGVLVGSLQACPNLVTVEGRVLKQRFVGVSTGVPGAIVALRSDGMDRVMRTNQFGSYSFLNVPACFNFYTISVRAWQRGLVFSPDSYGFMLPIPDDESSIVYVDFVGIPQPFHKEDEGS